MDEITHTGKSLSLPIKHDSVAKGTRYSKEFEAFLKETSGGRPRVTCRTLKEYYHIDGHTFEKQYKEVLSGFRYLGPVGSAGAVGLLSLTTLVLGLPLTNHRSPMVNCIRL